MCKIHKIEELYNYKISFLEISGDLFTLIKSLEKD